MMNGPLLIRADASPEIGGGHLMRCLALGQAYADLRGDVHFLTSESSTAMLERLKHEGFQIHAAGGMRGGRADACVTAGLAKDLGATWVCLDLPRFEQGFFTEFGDLECRTMLIDDLADQPRYNVDLLVNPNGYACPSMYGGKMAKGDSLLGEDFLLIRREVRALRSGRVEAGGAAHKVLVTLGASDVSGLTPAIVDALAEMKGVDAEIRVVRGPLADRGRLGRLDSVDGRVRVSFVEDHGALERHMKWADVAVTAGGGTCWELACLGRPMVATVVARNQVHLVEWMADRGVLVPVEGARRNLPGAIAAAVDSLLRDPDRCKKMSQYGHELVDGKGAERVVRHLQLPELWLRRATPGDCEKVWRWSNEAGVRAASFSPKPITWRCHVVWYEAALKRMDLAVFIGMDARHDDVGLVRFEVEGERAVISVAVDPARRGKGIGPGLIRAATRAALARDDVKRVDAYIKHDNPTSVTAFRKAGYRMQGEVTVGEDRAFHMRFK